MKTLIYIGLLSVIAWIALFMFVYRAGYNNGVNSVIFTPTHYKVYEIVEEDTCMYDLKGVYWYKAMDMSGPIWDSVWVASPTRKTVGYDKFFITDK